MTGFEPLCHIYVYVVFIYFAFIRMKQDESKYNREHWNEMEYARQQKTIEWNGIGMGKYKTITGIIHTIDDNQIEYARQQKTMEWLEQVIQWKTMKWSGICQTVEDNGME